MLHIESISAIKSENLVRLSEFFIWNEYAYAASGDDKLKKHILQLNKELGILQMGPDLTGPCQFSLFLEKYTSFIVLICMN